MNRSKIRSGKLVVVVTALLMLQGFASLAQANLQLDLYKAGTEIAKLKIVSPNTEATVLLTVKNAQGITLFSEKCKVDQYQKLISFSNIKNGLYYVDLEQDKGITRKVVRKEDTGISIEDGDLYFLNAIRLLEEDKNLLVRFNSNLKQAVTIRIMDQSGNIIHEESNIVTDNYISKYNLSNLLHGNYKISLISDAYSSTKSIRL